MKGESENVCNMPTICRIEIHKSEETGKYYSEFIQFRECKDQSECGVWNDKHISKKKMQEVINLIKGEHK